MPYIHHTIHNHNTRHNSDGNNDEILLASNESNDFLNIYLTKHGRGDNTLCLAPDVAQELRDKLNELYPIGGAQVPHLAQQPDGFDRIFEACQMDNKVVVLEKFYKPVATVEDIGAAEMIIKGLNENINRDRVTANTN